MLTFKPITIEAVEELLPFAVKEPTRSCDYTPGNLVMWARFMNYSYAIEQETLFIGCKSQKDLNTRSFLPPTGALATEDAIAILKEHCKQKGEELTLTAVPEPLLEDLQAALPTHSAQQLDGWSDYIYSAASLATLKGRALNKKRNRYNKFITENPGYKYSRFTQSDAKEVIQFLAQNRDCQHNRADNMRCYEQWQCLATVKNIERYSQPAGVLRIDGKIAAFTLGEVFGDTLYVHIEKADHNIAGTSEAINRFFVEDMLAEFPVIVYVNREEDLGDAGLRQVKRAYNPVIMLHRYELGEK